METLIYALTVCGALYIAYRFGRRDGEFSANDTEYWKGYRDALDDMERVGIVCGKDTTHLHKLIERHIDGGSCGCPLHKRSRWVYADQPDQDPDLG